MAEGKFAIASSSLEMRSRMESGCVSSTDSPEYVVKLVILCDSVEGRCATIGMDIAVNLGDRGGVVLARSMRPPGRAQVCL